MVLYFRWRTATMGTEIYWHGINDYSNRPNRRLAEAAHVGRELAAIGARVAGTQTWAEVAIVGDYANEWDGELDIWHGPYTRRSVEAWFTALQYAHIPVDALYLQPTTTLEDLACYRVLIYPHPAIMTDAAAALLTQYVRQGGTVVFGCRTGYKDANGQCPMRPLPGPVAELCGVSVEEWTRIEPPISAPFIRWRDSAEPPISADVFNDRLQVTAPGAEVLAEYADAEYAGAPALVRNPIGQGSAYYYGAVFNLDSAAALIRRLGLASPVDEWLELPPSVELCIRERAATGERLIFLLNYSATEQPITLRSTATDLLAEQQLQGAMLIAPFDVCILAQFDINRTD